MMVTGIYRGLNFSILSVFVFVGLSVLLTERWSIGSVSFFYNICRFLGTIGGCETARYTFLCISRLTLLSGMVVQLVLFLVSVFQTVKAYVCKVNDSGNGEYCSSFAVGLEAEPRLSLIIFSGYHIYIDGNPHFSSHVGQLYQFLYLIQIEFLGLSHGERRRFLLCSFAFA